MTLPGLALRETLDGLDKRPNTMKIIYLFAFPLK